MRTRVRAGVRAGVRTGTRARRAGRTGRFRVRTAGASRGRVSSTSISAVLSVSIVSKSIEYLLLSLLRLLRSSLYLGFLGLRHSLALNITQKKAVPVTTFLAIVTHIIFLRASRSIIVMVSLPALGSEAFATTVTGDLDD